MARSPKTVAEIDNQIEALKAQRKQFLEAKAAHIGKLATKAGLNELSIKDADLLKEFEKIAARFQEPTTTQ